MSRQPSNFHALRERFSIPFAFRSLTVRLTKGSGKRLRERETLRKPFVLRSLFVRNKGPGQRHICRNRSPLFANRSPQRFPSRSSCVRGVWGVIDPSKVFVVSINQKLQRRLCGSKKTNAQNTNRANVCSSENKARSTTIGEVFLRADRGGIPPSNPPKAARGVAA